jgi:hypothetical protein
MSAAPEATESARDSAGFFSSAKSFFLPVGPRLSTDELQGYPIDFRVKARDASWPPEWLPPRERQLWVDIAQWGLGSHERWLAGEGDQWLAGARACADHMLAEQEEDGSWVHRFRYPHSLPLPPGWLSAMAQGEGASLLLRVATATGEDRYADAARRALAPMPYATLDGKPWPEEYPTQPPSYVLNGAIFAMWGLHDVALALGDEQARAAFEEAHASLVANLHRWDTGRWSLYDLFPHPLSNPASSFYHRLHISQLEAFNVLAPHPELVRVRDRFQHYFDSPRHTRMAFVHKAVYRVMVPRNKYFAHRLPWTRKLAA